MRPDTTTASRNAHRAEYAARGAAISPFMTGLARLGYAVKGIVYLIIGGLALKLALGHGGAATDQRSALQTLYEQAFGKFLLVVAGYGLIAFAFGMLFSDHF